MLISVRDNKHGKNIRQIYVLRNISSTSDTVWLTNRNYHRVDNVTITFNRETVNSRNNTYVNIISKLATQPICVVNGTSGGGLEYDKEGILLFKNLVTYYLQLVKAKKIIP